MDFTCGVFDAAWAVHFEIPHGTGRRVSLLSASPPSLPSGNYDKPSSLADYQAYGVRNMTFTNGEPVFEFELSSFGHSGFVSGA